MVAYLLRNCSKKAGAIFSNGLSEQVFTSQEFIHRCFGETASTATRSTIGDRLFLALDVRRRHSCKARLLACCFLGYSVFKACFSWWLLVRELRFFTWFSIQEISFTTTRVSHCCAEETAFIEWQRFSSIGMTSLQVLQFVPRVLKPLSRRWIGTGGTGTLEVERTLKKKIGIQRFLLPQQKILKLGVSEMSSPAFSAGHFQ